MKDLKQDPMKISLQIAALMIIAAVVSAILGLITKQFDLFGCISLSCSYTGLLAGLIAWCFLIREWDRQEKKWEQENNNS